MDAFTLARQLRMGTMQGAVVDGVLDEETALEILGGNLDPGDPSTHCDDSALFKDPQAVDKIATSCPACHVPIGDYLTETWTKMSAIFGAKCPACGADLDVRARQFVKFEMKVRDIQTIDEVMDSEG